MTSLRTVQSSPRCNISWRIFLTSLQLTVRVLSFFSITSNVFVFPCWASVTKVKSSICTCGLSVKFANWAYIWKFLYSLPLNATNTTKAATEWIYGYMVCWTYYLVYGFPTWNLKWNLKWFTSTQVPLSPWAPWICCVNLF